MGYSKHFSEELKKGNVINKDGDSGIYLLLVMAIIFIAVFLNILLILIG